MAEEYLDKYAVAAQAAGDRMNLGEKVIGFTVAATTDFASTLWNSVVPEPYEVTTRDLLQKIDEDSLAVYDESQQSVELASFAAGVIIPQTLALKAINAARAGSLTLGKTSQFMQTFSGARKAKLAGEIETMFKAGQAATESFGKLRRAMILDGVANGVIDSTLMELAFVGTMNAHPYMEDYMGDSPGDFAKNFAIGAGIGAGIGAVAAFPAAARSIKSITMPIMEGELQKLNALTTPIPRGLSNADSYMLHDQNAKAYIKAATDPEATPLFKELASSYAAHSMEMQKKAMLSAADWMDLTDKANAGNAVYKDLMDELFSKSPNLGVDRVKKAEFSVEYSSYKPAQKLQEGFQRFRLEDGTEGIVTELPEGMAYVRKMGDRWQWYAPKGVESVTTVADLKDFERTGKGVLAAAPNSQFIEGVIDRANPAMMDNAAFVRELDFVRKQSTSGLKAMIAHENDIPRMNAIISELARRDAMDSPVNIISAKLAIEKEVAKRLYALGPDYQHSMANITQNSIHGVEYLSQDARNLADQWIHAKGGTGSDWYSKVKTAFSKVFRGEQLEEGTEQAAAELYKHGEALREQLRKSKLVDADGKVVLWRASTKTEKTGDVISSYSISKEGAMTGVSRSDAAAKPFRVHIDNIVAAIGGGPEYEILVSGAARKPLGQTPSSLFTEAATAVTKAEQLRTTQVKGSELLEMFTTKVEDTIYDLLRARTFSVEEISSRLGVTSDAVEWVGNGQKLADMVTEWRMFPSKEAADQFLESPSQFLRVYGRPNALNLHKMFSNLDITKTGILNKTIVQYATEIGGAQLPKAVHEFLGSDEFSAYVKMLDDGIAQMNNAAITGTFWSSADHALRETKMGPIVTYIGQRITGIIDKQKERLFTDLAASFQPLKDQAKLAMFNESINLMQGMQGYKTLEFDKEAGKYFIATITDKGKHVPAKLKGLEVYYIHDKDVAAALLATQKTAAELMGLHNTIRRSLGLTPIRDVGFYTPPQPLINKYFSYVIDNAGQRKTQLIVANTEAELAELETAFKAANKVPSLEVVSRGKNLERWNLIHDYADYDPFITWADVSKVHKGASALAITPSDDRIVNAIIQGFDHQLTAGMKKYTQLYLDDTMSKLDTLSDYYTARSKGQPILGVFKKAPTDAARYVKNVLLGNNQTEISTTWKTANELTDMLLNKTLHAVDKVAATIKPGAKISQESFDALNKELEAIGATKIWDSFDQYFSTTIAESRPLSKNFVSVTNGLAATLTLRMFDLAQAAVNVMSMPILGTASLMERLPTTKIGQAEVKLPLRTMYDGMRFMLSPEGKGFNKMIEEFGHVDQAVRQYTELVGTLQRAHVGKHFTEQALDTLERFQNSGAIKNFLARPADFAETFTRRLAMNTGFLAAKRAYPGLDDMGAIIYANNFANRSIGNYFSAQRPALFQGTLGAAIGLYQTYLWTFGQSVYRMLEQKQYRALGGMMLAQAGIFGMSSFPGYNALSQTIGNYFSSENYDLTTGTYRALPDPIAELVLYGLPSSITGMGFYTRGDVNPRVPGVTDDFVLINAATQAYSTAGGLIGALVKQDGTGKLQAMAEALSLQSMNRPIARLSEIAMGESITQKGNTVSTAEDIWTFTGVASRLLATRPLEEQTLRNAIHLNSYYGAADFEARQKAVNKLKTALRAGNLTDDMVSSVAHDYLTKGGSATGWRSVMNETMVTTGVGARQDLLMKLEPSSPLRRMIDENY